MLKLRSALAGETEPGVYRFRSHAAPRQIQHAVERLGWRYFYLDGQQIVDQSSFLRTCTGAIHVPDFFAASWEDFSNLLVDMEWAPALGYVILYDATHQFAERDPEHWALALQIFRSAVLEWRAAGKPFYVLLRHADAVAAGLPVL